MNRAERRKSGIKTRAKTYTLNDSQIKQIKADAVKEAIDTAFIYMLGLPVMIIHDKYPQLMKKLWMVKVEKKDLLIYYLICMIQLIKVMYRLKI